jgi:hypothetical protein
LAIFRNCSWKRFSLRGMFVLTTVVCVGLGLWSVYLQPFRTQATSVAALNKYDASFTASPADGPAWQRWLVTQVLGKDAFVRVDGVALSDTRFDDQAATALVGLPYLRRLNLERTQISDAGLASIASLPRLEELSLAYTRMTDQGVPMLRQLPKLADLKLTGTAISDASVSELIRLPAIRMLYVRWTSLTNEGAKKLTVSLPNCEVHYQARRKAP